MTLYIPRTECEKLIVDNLIDMRPVDFPNATKFELKFLFNLRGKYMQYQNMFDCSEKQFNLLKSILDKNRKVGE